MHGQREIEIKTISRSMVQGWKVYSCVYVLTADLVQSNVRKGFETIVKTCLHTRCVNPLPI